MGRKEDRPAGCCGTVWRSRDRVGNAMWENFFALLLAMYSPVYLTPEKAFEYLADGSRIPSRPSRKSHCLSDADTAEMVRLRQTMTFREIAEAYDVDVHCVFLRIQKTALPGKQPPKRRRARRGASNKAK